MGGCQNHGPLLGPLNTRCRIVLRIQKEATILTTTYIYTYVMVSLGQSLSRGDPAGLHGLSDGTNTAGDSIIIDFLLRYMIL